MLPGPALKPSDAMARMRVPAGFTVELVASEPMIVNPVAMCFDEKGRIWITESVEYPRSEPGIGKDRIKVLEDTNGDGVADKTSVFVQEPALLAPLGIAVIDNKIIVSCAPDIIVYTDVDGPDGSKMKASVLYPNDPKRRLEVLWNNDAARSDTSVIAINGRSQWAAPKGIKLGMTLAALEKLNGRPFKLNGFGPDGSASIAGWEGGALATLPGGCKVGGRLMIDAKAPSDARGAVEGDKELMSNDDSLKAVKPTVGEILIGY